MNIYIFYIQPKQKIYKGRNDFWDMQIITKQEARLKREEIVDRILNGEVFIYPTDTIYGIGCDATNSKAVQKIREIKQRPDQPFSVIAPSFEWIKKNCVLTAEAEKWLKQLPGPLTLILKLKNPKCVAKEVVPKQDGTLGVRIPAHWIWGITEKADVPIVTTSVNITDKPFMTNLDDLEPEISGHISFALDEGPKEGRPSKIIHLDKEEVKIRER
jgi:L-threonylcarbamoyladenylate synthase